MGNTYGNAVEQNINIFNVGDGLQPSSSKNEIQVFLEITSFSFFKLCDNKIDLNNLATLRGTRPALGKVRALTSTVEI